MDPIAVVSSARRVALVVLVVAAATSCLDVDVKQRVEVHQDGSGSLTAAVLFDSAALSELGEQMGGEPLSGDDLVEQARSMRDDQDNKDLEIEPLTDGTRSGVRVHQRFATLEELNEFFGENEHSVVKFSRRGDEWRFEANTAPSEDDTMAGSEVTLSVSLPGKVVSTNGKQTSDGVTWVFHPGDGGHKETMVTSTASSGSTWRVVGGLIGLALAAVAVTAAVLHARRLGARQPIPAGPPDQR